MAVLHRFYCILCVTWLEECLSGRFTQVLLYLVCDLAGRMFEGLFYTGFTVSCV